jgi:NTP pyrophosphatase (non-canonical NTP hydrolase)
VNQDSYEDMLQSVRSFHEKHRFRETGGEEMTYRISLMAEELGEISACVTKGRPKEELSEELADLFILIVGTALAQKIDLKSAFWTKMEKIGKRGSRMVNGRIRVSDFCEKNNL